MAGYQIINNGIVFESGRFTIQYFFSIKINELSERVMNGELSPDRIFISIDQ